MVSSLSQSQIANLGARQQARLARITAERKRSKTPRTFTVRPIPSSNTFNRRLQAKRAAEKQRLLATRGSLVPAAQLAQRKEQQRTRIARAGKQKQTTLSGPKLKRQDRLKPIAAQAPPKVADRDVPLSKFALGDNEFDIHGAVREIPTERLLAERFTLAQINKAKAENREDDRKQEKLATLNTEFKKYNLGKGQFDFGPMVANENPADVELFGFTKQQIFDQRKQNALLRKFKPFMDKEGLIDPVAARLGGVTDKQLAASKIFSDEDRRQANSAAMTINRLKPFTNAQGTDLDGGVAKLGPSGAITKQGLLDAQYNPRDIHNAFERIPERTPFAKGKQAGNFVLDITPFYGTYRTWETSSNLQRSLNLGFDALTLIPIAGGTAAGVRAGSKVLPAITKSVIAEAVAPITAIRHPVKTIKTLVDPIEILVNPKRIPVSALTIRRRTIKFPLSKVEAVGGTPTDAKIAASAATIDMINTGKGVSPVGATGKAFKISKTVASKASSEPLGIHATNNLEVFMNGAVVKGGREGGLFLAPSLHPRFSFMSAGGDITQGGLRGALLIRDVDVLSTLKGSGKSFQAVVEQEAVLRPGTKIPPPSQYLFTRDDDGRKIVLAVVGKPYTPEEIIKLKFFGSVESVRQMFRSPIRLSNSKDARDARDSFTEEMKIRKEIADTLAKIKTANRTPRKRSTVIIQDRRGIMVVKGKEIGDTNFILPGGGQGKDDATTAAMKELREELNARGLNLKKIKDNWRGEGHHSDWDRQALEHDIFTADLAAPTLKPGVRLKKPKLDTGLEDAKLALGKGALNRIRRPVEAPRDVPKKFIAEAKRQGLGEVRVPELTGTQTVTKRTPGIKGQSGEEIAKGTRVRGRGARIRQALKSKVELQLFERRVQPSSEIDKIAYWKPGRRNNPPISKDTEAILNAFAKNPKDLSGLKSNTGALGREERKLRVLKRKLRRANLKTSRLNTEPFESKVVAGYTGDQDVSAALEAASKPGKIIKSSDELVVRRLKVRKKKVLQDRGRPSRRRTRVKDRPSAPRRPSFGRVGGRRPGAGRTPAGRTPAGRVPAGRTPAGRVPAGRVPAGRVPAGRVPAGRVPAGRVPAGRVPGGRVPGGRTPGGRTPGGRTPGGRTPGGRTPGGRTPGGRTPGGRRTFPRFQLPKGKKLPQGVFPKIVKWRQGAVNITLDIDTGAKSFERSATKVTKGKTPRDSFGVIAIDKTRPKPKSFRQGSVIIDVTPDSLRFRGIKQRRGL